MSLELAILLALLGLAAAFLSGLLGIGGALMLIPMLLYVPEALGLRVYDAREASAIAICQVAVASFAATVSNLRRRLVYRRLVMVVVGTMIAASFVAGWASQFIPAKGLLLMLALLAVLGASSMLMPVTGLESGPRQPPFNPTLALLCGLLVGSMIGLIGGGSFLLIPLQVYLLGIPTRTAMATGLAAVLPTAFAGAIGKGLGGQIPLLEAALVCALALPGAHAGTLVGSRLSARVLRRVYAIVVLSVAAGLWFDVLNAR